MGLPDKVGVEPQHLGLPVLERFGAPLGGVAFGTDVEEDGVAGIVCLPAGIVGFRYCPRGWVCAVLAV